MERYATAVGHCDLVQTTQQLGWQLPWARDRVRGQERRDLRDLRRSRLGGADFGLDLTHEVLALISTANPVDVRRIEAVRRRVQVVGNDHLPTLGVGVIKRAKSSQVLSLFNESPVRMERLLVEGGERHPAGLVVFHGHQGTFQTVALHIVELMIILANALHKLHHGGETELVVLTEGLQTLSHPVLGLLPPEIFFFEDLRHVFGLRCAVRRELSRFQESHVIGSQHCLRLRKGKLARAYIMDRVRELQTGSSFAVDKILDGCREHCGFVK
mmetsp:Transcript_23257/g.61080  ORF Transcript_23257/g.61080 Transcript_23257/m.61080 type:complete len:271 (-) Transcript_23257:465-1277(-)